MLISQKQLLHLPVETKSGEFLGKICSWDMDTENQFVVKYYLKKTNLIQELLTRDQEYIIPSQEVVTITKEKMIVEDNLANLKEISFKEKKAPILEESGVASMRHES